MYSPKKQQKIQKIFLDFDIIAFELVVLDTRFYWERILVIECQYIHSSRKILDTTKTEFSELICFRSDQKVWLKYCRADLRSLSDRLTCWLSISVLTRGFLGISVTLFFAVYNFMNK